MRLLSGLAAAAFWFTLWIAIPAALLYPFALWMANHTQISGYALAQIYIGATCILFQPAGFRMDHIYGHRVRDRRSKRLDMSQTSDS